MKRFFLTLLLFSALTTGCDLLQEPSTGISDEEIARGLKEALRVGTDSSVMLLNRTDGYFKDQAVKILLPQEVQQVQQLIETTVPGADILLNEVVLKMNRAAEDAAAEAAPIFKDAITNITIQDARDILFGADSAATVYLENQTRSQLFAAYSPKVQASLDEVGLPALWGQIATPYNQFANSLPGQLAGAKPIPDDLSEYVTNKALDGLFVKIQDKEKDIRTNLSERVTDLLQKVFGLLNNK